VILVKNVHDFEKFTIFSAFVIIIAGSCDSSKLMEKEMLSYHLPKLSNAGKDTELIDRLHLCGKLGDERKVARREVLRVLNEFLTRSAGKSFQIDARPETSMKMKSSEYVRLNVIHKYDIETPARVPPY
jgi:hypothetical protein